METRILIVDENIDHRSSLTEACIMYSCLVKGCESEDDALECVRNWQPHLVICDSMMNKDKFRGWRFAYRLLKDENSHRPYLVALTGFFQSRDRRLCEECGFDEYLHKPTELSTLYAVICKARQRFEARNLERK